MLIALLLVITYLLLDRRESEWEPPKADGKPLELQVIEGSPIVPVEYRDCAGRQVLVMRSDVAKQFNEDFYAVVDAMQMWSSNEAGCLDPGVYEEFLSKQTSQERK
ncbi:MAG: hypothetical protein OXE02_06015 [Chloroflexi bacterium]|nr:hypothetical protein [Chloroflexota bacterium]